LSSFDEENMAPPPNTATKRDLPKFIAILSAVIVVLAIILYIGNDWYGSSRGTDEQAPASGAPGQPATMPPGSQPQGTTQQ
jgi:hypothetical protein